ncbi:tetratricopeptide repeat protein 12 [Drosophila guanche]|uniref:Blast:Tetratricopeptide repeat protein 12 n=1 Tax=Drosophila guanche TaxID=7266 RepID=A0A3B0JM78_DROGU|nr:tetratricopeptide repeat protein 12 [Drosophila guanche]SPP83367.1 blast:Tetratricopeptide repeat protein 12 [Drosophila guanche]
MAHTKRASEKKPNPEDIPEYIIYQHPHTDEEFIHGQSTVDDVLQLMEAIGDANKADAATSKEKKNYSEKLTDQNYVVTSRSIYGSNYKRSRSKTKVTANTNQFTFMRQVDLDLRSRQLVRIERERVADNFRRLGNHEYRKENYQLAIQQYTRGLATINDTPVLYVNRALCYIKRREFKRAIMDCDHILTYLDPKYLRAWLYKAAANKRLNDESHYQLSVYMARRSNHNEDEFIDNFLDKMRSHL